MLELYFLTYLSIFSIYQDAYVNVNSLYIKFLYTFFLPDVASASSAAFTFVSLVLSVPLTLVEDDEVNKVQFVLIDASHELTKTLNLYCITHNTLPLLLHILYI